MIVLVFVFFLPLLSFAQFPVTDGINDLFAVLTQCPITPTNPPEKYIRCDHDILFFPSTVNIFAIVQT